MIIFYLEVVFYNLKNRFNFKADITIKYKTRWKKIIRNLLESLGRIIHQTGNGVVWNGYCWISISVEMDIEILSCISKSRNDTSFWFSLHIVGWTTVSYSDYCIKWFQVNYISEKGWGLETSYLIRNDWQNLGIFNLGL